PLPPPPPPPPTAEPSPLPINRGFPGITTFRGNASRSYLGEGPVPRDPEIIWRFPATGEAMCSEESPRAGEPERLFCGVGWTGQANVVAESGGFEVRFGANDGDVHFLDGRTGQPVRPSVETAGLAKGSMTSDPDGYPLVYVGSTDGKLRIFAIDRDVPEELWSLDATTSVDRPLWNDDWDGSPLIVRDHLIEGGENSWFYVVRLHRGYDDAGKVTVDPEIVVREPGWDDELLAALGDEEVSIENSVAYRDGIAYLANSGGLVQGWDISDVLDGGSRAERVFRFWMGDDVDATIVIDPDGALYVASQLQRLTARSTQIGQLVKLDPTRTEDPVVWSLRLDTPGFDGSAGVWATPALSDGILYVATHAGELLGVDAATGRVLWTKRLEGPTWGSPVVVDGVLLEADCTGHLFAFDVARSPRSEPPLLWDLEVAPGCVEATPVVWRGWIFLGDRSGGFLGIADRR
ncbi:MAG: PQQ-binding-like beta-propeller repeat protein, partial [Actinomycetota bacterium]